MVKMFRSKPVREVGPALRLSGTAIRLNTSLVSTETTAEASESRPAIMVPVTWLGLGLGLGLGLANPNPNANPNPQAAYRRLDPARQVHAEEAGDHRAHTWPGGAGER